MPAHAINRKNARSCNNDRRLRKPSKPQLLQTSGAQVKYSDHRHHLTDVFMSAGVLVVGSRSYS